MGENKEMDRETLRKVQLVQLEIAKEIKRVCEENNIQYSLDSGTLLGAVRHKGFIPWDDDLDMAMMRNEYERFMQIAPQKLDSKYELITWKNEPMYPNQFSKVIKKGTVYREETRHDDGKNGIYVDIFAYDHFPDDIKVRKIHGFKIMAYRAMIRAKCHTKMWTYQNHFYLGRWAKNLPFRFASLFYTKSSLVTKYEAEAQKYNNTETELLFPQGCTKYGRWVIPKKCFYKYIEIPFEDTYFKAPVGYDEYLKYAYGDYMKLPSEDKRENRHAIVELSFGERED